MRKMWMSFWRRFGLYRLPEQGLLFNGRPIPYLEDIDILHLETSRAEWRQPMGPGPTIVTITLVLTGTPKERRA